MKVGNRNATRRPDQPGMRTGGPERLPKIRIQIDNGRFQILGLGAWHSYWRDPYYLMLTVPWQGFVAINIALYAAANAICACIYLLGGYLLGEENTILNARPGSFSDAFFFSVQTSASIGYGVMSPGTTFGHLVVTLEAIISLICIAVLTGLTYARFSRPTAQVLFSKNAVIGNFQGVPTLMFRAANERRNQILEAQMRVYFILDEHYDGRILRRFYDLALLRDRNPSFSLTWTAFHPIDPTSPLYGRSRDEMLRTNAGLLVSLSGIDQTVSQAIHTRHTYYTHDILWERQFKDIIHVLENGDRAINFANFHEVEEATK
jgi:inward rectifier potassium channel